MVILRCFDLSVDDYTLLCECARGKPFVECVLAERTLLFALKNKNFVRLSEHSRSWILTDLGDVAVEAIGILAKIRPGAGPASIIPIRNG
jgi:hypothetical protein